MYEESSSTDQEFLASTSATSLPCKTPVTVLQELCLRRRFTPKYELRQMEGSIHEPVFIFEVTVGEFTACGSGTSKKKAKHAAAKYVLDILAHGNGEDASSTDPNSESILSPDDCIASDLRVMVQSPVEDFIKGNPVGELQEHCFNHRWPSPTYEVISEIGLAHDRTFTIACTISTFKEVATAASKKIAKRQAAQSMMERLSKMPCSKKYSEGDKIMKECTAKPNYFKMLLEMDEGATFIHTSEEGESQCVVQLSVVKDAVCYGSGTTVDEAQEDAAHNAIEHIKMS